MSYLTRPSNVRVYQFRQPPLLRRRILPVPTPKGQRIDVGKLLSAARVEGDILAPPCSAYLACCDSSGRGETLDLEGCVPCGSYGPSGEGAR